MSAQGMEPTELTDRARFLLEQVDKVTEAHTLMEPGTVEYVSELTTELRRVLASLDATVKARWWAQQSWRELQLEDQ